MAGINRDPDKKTALCWLKEGRLVKEGSVGECLYPNGYCQKTATYFHISDTYIASKEELRTKREPYLRKQREKAQKKRALERERKYIEKQLKDALLQPVVPFMNPSGVVAFDIETTGCDPSDDEILQFSAVDGDGTVLLDSYVKPYRKKSWKGAVHVNGITPDMVKDAPLLHELIPKIRGVFLSANLLVTYNGEFDARFLSASGIDLDSIPEFDVMLQFAPVYGDYNEYYGNYRFKSLSFCASYYGYEFKAHDAREDALATLFCWKRLSRGNISDD